ncbi:hypothetical protein [Luteimonas sp. A501]
MARSIAATVICLIALLWSGAFLMSAVAHGSALVWPIQNVGFGPHVMPWSEVIFLFVRGLAGVVVAISLYRLVGRRPHLSIALIAAAVVVIVHYSYYLLQFWPDAKYLNVSVLAFLSPVLIIDLGVHIVILVIASWRVIRVVQARRSGA